MNTAQLEALKLALRRQWEAEQEIARIEKEMLRPVGQPTIAALLSSSPIAQMEAADAPILDAKNGKPKSLPQRIIELLKSNHGRSIPTREFVATFSDANAPSVRSALNRMIGREIARATDASGKIVPEHYVLRKEDS